MHTAMALAALTLSAATGNVSGTPAWLDDYQVARARVADVGKPLVVVIGRGEAGWRDVVRDGLDPAVTKVLADKFVCLYADTTTAKGQQLAAALRVRQGVVISDRTGKSQAFNASGTVSRSDLMTALVRYADQPEVTRTEFQTTTTTTSVPQGTVQGGTVVQPAPAGGTVISGGTVVQPGMPMQPGAPVYTGPVGAPVMGGYGAGGACCGGGGGYAMGGGACCGGGGYAMGGCGGGGHKCCGLFGGMFGGGWGGGYGGGGCCGGGYSSGCGGGGKCCGGGMFGGMFGGWGGGYGGGWGHGGGCCK
jgi:hypothetical protein